MPKHKMPYFKVAAADMKYFARSKYFGRVSSQEKFLLNMTSSLQVSMLILSTEVGYFL